MAVDEAGRALIAKYGVAYGLDTNVGTVWLQQPDHLPQCSLSSWCSTVLRALAKSCLWLWE